ncbi:ComEA family DNA-binding protein [Lunatibacter salilacus]|uniref:ComEA family DNA-binding protein n=1 Tax=Lunatibacter salilacus TaxID=2483804 RepID=UPI00131CB21A|nr:helix-hairpin-helix domain-containing protein [Lunatibacter salilacus]
MLVFLYLLPMVLEKAMSAKHVREYQHYLKEAESALDQISTTSSPWNQADSLRQEKRDTSKQEDLPTKRMVRIAAPILNKVAFHETDSVLLQMVSGVGPVLSSRIIKFRESMGGFHQPEQLLDVYGLTPEVAERIYSAFPFEAVVTKKISLNSDDAKQLSKHPYISASEAKVIVAYRHQHGNYQKATDLLHIKIFNQAWLDRIIPYLEW